MQSWMHWFFKQFKGNAEAKMIASQIKNILIFRKMRYPMVCMLSSFLLGYADSHALSDITTFIGFWQLACQLWLQN